MRLPAALVVKSGSKIRSFAGLWELPCRCRAGALRRGRTGRASLRRTRSAESSAAEKGHAEAEYQLGRLHAQGHGRPHDEKEAAKWVEKAASQGHALAQARLGMRYADGRGVEQDPAQGCFWLALAARQGETTGEKTRTALAAKLGPAAASRVESAAKRWVPARPGAAKW
jgi:hypothetical protein